MRGPTMDDSDPGRGRTNLQAARMPLLRPAPWMQLLRPSCPRSLGSVDCSLYTYYILYQPLSRAGVFRMAGP